MPANLENSAVATGLKRSVFIPISKKAMSKNVQTTTQLHSSHMLCTARDMGCSAGPAQPKKKKKKIDCSNEKPGVKSIILDVGSS